MSIYPEDIVEGSDSTIHDVASGLFNMARSFDKNESLHRGNVEWLERLAANMRFVLEDFENAEADAIQRAEIRAETFAAEAIMGMRPGTTEGWYDERPYEPDEFLDAEYEGRFDAQESDLP